MRGKRQRREAGIPRFDAEFFVEFADQRCLGRFARFDFTTREFPESREGLSFGPLRKQDAPIDVDERDC